MLKRNVAIEFSVNTCIYPNCKYGDLIRCVFFTKYRLSGRLHWILEVKYFRTFMVLYVSILKELLHFLNSMVCATCEWYSIYIKRDFSSSDEVAVKFKGAKSYLYNSYSGNSPLVIHGNGPIKARLYLPQAYLVYLNCYEGKSVFINL